VRRLVHDCIRAGLAGHPGSIDQPIEGKRATQTPGIEVVSRDAAVDRYRAAVRARDELDPDFVIHWRSANARDRPVNGGMHELVERLNAYWNARVASTGCSRVAPFDRRDPAGARRRSPARSPSCKGKLVRPLTLAEHFALGLRIAWYTFLPDQVLKANELGDSCGLSKGRDIDAWTASRPNSISYRG